MIKFGRHIRYQVVSSSYHSRVADDKAYYFSLFSLLILTTIQLINNTINYDFTRVRRPAMPPVKRLIYFLY